MATDMQGAGMIDPHVHVEALNRSDLESMALAGINAVVAMVSLPEVHENIQSDSVFQYCDRVLHFHSWRARESGIEVYLCPGISMVGIPIDYKEGLTMLRSYLKEKHERVVGIGEIGLEPSSATCPDLKIQEEVLSEQLEIAKELNKPIVLHTPPIDKSPWVQRYLAMLKEHEIDPQHVVIDHADGTVVKAITKASCYAAITVQPWRRVRPSDAAEAVNEGDPDRVYVDSDSSLNESDPLGVAKTALEMRRRGTRLDLIRKVVRENARHAFNIMVNCGE
jgi:hypothetical protein